MQLQNFTKAENDKAQNNEVSVRYYETVRTSSLHCVEKFPPVVLSLQKFFRITEDKMLYTVYMGTWYIICYM